MFVFFYKILYKNTYNRIALLMVLVIVIAFIYIGTVLDNIAERDYGDTLSNLRDDIVAERNFYEMRVEDTDDDPIYQLYRVDSRILNRMIWTHTDMVGTIMFEANPDLWRDLLEMRIQRKEIAVDTIETLRKLEAFDVLDGLSLLPTRYVLMYGTEENLQSQIAMLKIMLDEDIKPLFSEYNMSAYQFLYKILLYIFPFLIPMAVFLLYNSNPSESMQFMLLQPVRKRRIYLVEFVVNTGAIYLTLILFLIIGFFGAAVVNGFGYSNYPLSETVRVSDAIVILLMIMPIYLVAISGLCFCVKRFIDAAMK